jgi:hypothetical protein
MANIQGFIATQANEYSKIVVPMTTRGVPLKGYASNAYDFPTDHGLLKPTLRIQPIPESTRVIQKNNNIRH